MRRLTQALRGRDAGQVIFIMPLFVFLFLLFGVLIFDMGVSFAQRRDYQGTVDMAALAAVVELFEEDGDAEGIGQQWLERNGFDTSVAGTWTVDILDPETVRVWVSTPRPPVLSGFLSNLVGQPVDWEVGAYAIARARRVPLAYSLMAMNPGPECRTMWASGQGDINITGGGGTYTNSTCSSGNSAMRASGGGTFNGAHHHVVGGISTAGGGTIQECHEVTGVCTQGATTGYSPQRPDPFRDLEPPEVPSSCPAPSGPVLAAGCHSRLSIGAGATVTLAEGVHIFKATSGPNAISVSSGSLLSSGPVLVYATCDPSPCNGETVNVNINGDAVALTGREEYANVVIWLDRTAGPGSSVDLQGQANAGLAGSIYNINGSVKIAGGGNGTSTELNISVVADDITITGGGSITFAWNPLTAPSELQAYLIE